MKAIQDRRNKVKNNAVIAIFLLLTAIFTGSCNADNRTVRTVPKTIRSDPSYPLVGAIRWDFWFKGSPMIKKALSESQWRYRLPFFAQVQTDGSIEVSGDHQETVDREILAAVEGGIDYWAFIYYHNKSGEGKPIPLEILKGNLARQRYLSSRYRNQLNHALIMPLGHLTNETQWFQITETVLLPHFRMDNYQRVLGSRPLLYMLSMKDSSRLWSPTGKGKTIISRIREKSQKAGLGNPYIVLMHFYPEEAIQMLKSTNYDAISTYANPTGDYNQSRPFSYCVSLNHWFRAQFRDRGVQLIPTIVTGWDTRPLIGGRDPYVERSQNNDFCQTATPQEIGNHLLETLRWIRVNRSFNETNSVLIYAWNEYSEGGWLSPMLIGGNERLRATRRALEANHCEITKKSANCTNEFIK